VLSELPAEWAEEVREWRRLLRGTTGIEAPPDANDEYYLYQSLLGAWPAELCDQQQLDGDAVAAFAERLRNALQKALREAKRHTTWATPDERYEGAAFGLIDAAVGSDARNGFLERFVPFASRIARLGVDNSLVQLALKMTAPGVPDIYQGCELWDFSFVDPDNRRRVDFAAREVLLEMVEKGLAADPVRAFERWRREWRDGCVKLAATRVLLALRSREAAVLAAGDYSRCEVTGPRAGEIVAFARRREERCVVTAVRRFPVRAERDSDWRGTRIRLPHDAADAIDIFTRRGVSGPDVDPARLFAALPVAVLAPRDDGKA
jgi:(1->4)-alpha-D-glucan 1-alpha-D-glucosylmutase